MILYDVSLGVLRWVLGRPGESWTRLGRLGGVLGASWGRLGVSWARLGASWERLGASEGHPILDGIF